MRATFNWIKDYCPFPGTVEEMAALLTGSGTEVEHITPLGDDFRLDIEVTSNRTDCLGIIGLAREVSAVSGIPLVLPFSDYACGDEKIGDLAAVTVEAPDLCPRYMAALVRGVSVGPSPDWLVQRLEVVGGGDLRPINNIVDVTNYVLLEQSQPLHAFDFNRLAERRLVVRRARPGETMTAIDHRRYTLDPAMLVIADARRPQCLAGVMGAKDSEIGPECTDVLLECASFDPRCIWETSRRLRLASESSFRFERGVNTAALPVVMGRAARLLQEVAGGEIAGGLLDVRAWEPKERTVRLRHIRLRQVMGYHVAAVRQDEILSRLGLVRLSGDTRSSEFRVPAHRPDLAREIDLVEEIARVEGLDRVPDRLDITVHTPDPQPRRAMESRATRMLEGWGYHETITDTFVPETGWRSLSPWTDAPRARVRNPVREDEAALRAGLLPSLLRARLHNQSVGEDDVRLFELARAFLPETKGVRERMMLAALADGQNLRDARGVVEALLNAEGVEFRVQPLTHPLFADGAAVRYTASGAPLAVAGVASGALCAEDIGLRASPALLEVDMTTVNEHAQGPARYRTPARYPGARRDFSFLVDHDVPWSRLEETVRGLGIAALANIEFDHEWRGKGVPAGKRSLTFSVLFQAEDRTLTGEELDAWQQAVVQAVQETCSAVLR